MEQLSKTLQYKNINAQEVSTAVNAAKSFLERQRDHLAFKSFYYSVVREARDLTGEPMLPREDEFHAGWMMGYQIIILSHLKIFLENSTMKFLICFSVKFNQPAFSVLQEIETMIIDSCNGKTHVISSNFEVLYTDCLEIPKLKSQ